MDEEQYYELKKISNRKEGNVVPALWQFLKDNRPTKKRTSSQNAAMHVNFNLIAEKMNDAGYSVQNTIITDIPWDTATVKKYIWKPIQKILLDKESTTELDKLGEIDLIHKVVMRELGEKKQIEFHEFPFDPEKRRELEARTAPTDGPDIDYPEEESDGIPF